MAELVLALNTRDLREALSWAKEIPARWVKLGLGLFSGHGPGAVAPFLDAGKKVFLDLKLHDIPSVVEDAAGALTELGVSMITVSGLAGPGAIAGAVRAFRGRVVVVTVLTSLTPEALGRLGMELGSAVLAISGWAAREGAWGVVCSGWELARVKAKFPSLGTVVPGVRLDDEVRDQARVVRPEEVKDADFVVVGRPITHSPDPLAQYHKYLRALEQ